MKDVQQWTRAMEKQVAYRVNTVLCDRQFLSIHQHFGGEIFRRSSIFHGLEVFLREQDVRGDTALEIGTWTGLTSVVLSRRFRRVVTLDIVDHPMKYQVMKHLGITNVEFVNIASNSDKPGIIGKLDFDFAYLDGDHHSDTELDFGLTKKCGKLLFQECWRHQSPVWELVNSLPQEEVVYGGFGLALWQAKKG